MESKKVLVVDDEEELLGLIGKTLTNEGYEPVLAATAKDALDRIKKEEIALILIDIMLPDMEGPEVIRLLSEDPATANIPAIFLSGIVTRQDPLAGPSSEVLVGKCSYKALSKPFSSQELMAEVRKTLY